MPIGAWSYDDLPGVVVERLGLDAGARPRPRAPGRRRDADPCARRGRRRGSPRATARVVLLAGAEGTRAMTRARRPESSCRGRRPARARPSRRWIRCCSEPRPSASGVPCTASRCTSTRCARTRASSLADAQAESGAMWSGLTEVAAANPYAWSRSARTAARRRRRVGRQPHGVVPVSEVAHGEPVREPGCRAARDRRRHGPRRSASPRTAGCTRSAAPAPTSPPTRGRAPRTTTSPRSTSPCATCRRSPARTADEYDVVELYSCFPAMPKLTPARARTRRDRADLGDRRALVLRWTGQQLPHPLAGGDGRAPARRRWDGVHPRRRHVQHEAPRAGAAPTIPAPTARIRRRATTWGCRARRRPTRPRGRGLLGPGHRRHVHAWCSTATARPSRAE